MGTSFEEIYCLNTVIIKDPTIARLPIYQYYSLCYKQLQFAITMFVYDCLQDIEKFIPYTENEYNFIGNGIDTQFNISPIPIEENKNIYVGIFDEDEIVFVENYDYTYDVQTNIITFNNAPKKDAKIVISFYNIGSFNAVLNIKEKVILAEAMNVPFLERYQNNIRSLVQIPYTSSYKMHSQAEQIKQLSNIATNQRNLVSALVIEYSFRNSKDRLKGLTGRGGRSGC